MKSNNVSITISNQGEELLSPCGSLSIGYLALRDSDTFVVRKGHGHGHALPPESLNSAVENYQFSSGTRRRKPAKSLAGDATSFVEDEDEYDDAKVIKQYQTLKYHWFTLKFHNREEELRYQLESSETLFQPLVSHTLLGIVTVIHIAFIDLKQLLGGEHWLVCYGALFPFIIPMIVFVPFVRRWWKYSFTMIAIVQILFVGMGVSQSHQVIFTGLQSICNYSVQSFDNICRIVDPEPVLRQSALMLGICVMALFTIIDISIGTAGGVDFIFLTLIFCVCGAFMIVLVKIYQVTPEPYTFAIIFIGLVITLGPSRLSETRSRTNYNIQQVLLQKHREEYRKRVEAQVGQEKLMKRLRGYENPNEEERDAVDKILMKNPTLKASQINFRDIEFEKIIGAGSFGEVLLGTYSGTRVAVKRLLRHRINECYLRSFVQELELINKLRHPNIVQFIGASWDSISNICIVFEYMERGSLREVLDTYGSEPAFTWEDPCLRMAIDIARGLAYLHSRRPPVIHRDLKSGNVLVSSTFGCKLADFGLSRHWTEEDTMTITGTPLWFPPEMIRSDRYSEKADMYSFGVLLTELDSKKLPYHDVMHQPESRMTSTKLMHLVAYSGLRPSISDSCPSTIRGLTQLCLNGDPDERPSALDALNILLEIMQETALFVGSESNIFDSQSSRESLGLSPVTISSGRSISTRPGPLH